VSEIFEGIKFPPMFMSGAKIVAVFLVLIFLHIILRVIFTKKRDLQGKSKVYLYPKSIRIWHWTNVVIFLVLLISGFAWWLKIIQERQTFNMIHISFGVLFVFGWTFLVAYNACGNYSNYKVTKSTFKDAYIQIKYYLCGIFKGENSPHTPTKDNKFNALQKISYFFMVYFLVPMLIITGMLCDVPQIRPIMFKAHVYFCVFASVLFIIMHIYMVLSSKKLKAMIDGHIRD